MSDDKPWLFKPGQSGNPAGRAKMPDDVREGRKLNQIEVARIFNNLVNLSEPELKAILKNPETKALELLICRIMVEAMKSGDHQRVNFILDRMIGKVTEKAELKVSSPGITVNYVADEDKDDKSS